MLSFALERTKKEFNDLFEPPAHCYMPDALDRQFPGCPFMFDPYEPMQTKESRMDGILKQCKECPGRKGKAE